jgi:hypothetical protein
MARKPAGGIVEHEALDGRVYRSLRFTAYGKREFQSLGPLSRAEAERALQHVLADVERGTWQPTRTVQAAPEPEPVPVPTVHRFAERGGS